MLKQALPAYSEHPLPPSSVPRTPAPRRPSPDPVALGLPRGLRLILLQRKGSSAPSGACSGSVWGGRAQPLPGRSVTSGRRDAGSGPARRPAFKVIQIARGPHLHGGAARAPARRAGGAQIRSAGPGFGVVLALSRASLSSDEYVNLPPPPPRSAVVGPPPPQQFRG